MYVPALFLMNVGCAEAGGTEEVDGGFGITFGTVKKSQKCYNSISCAMAGGHSLG